MNYDSDSIAIVGVGCVFPGALSAEIFWQNILEKKNAAKEMPTRRAGMPIEKVYHTQPRRSDRVISKLGCFVDDEDLPLPLDEIRLLPEEIRALDPSTKLALYAASQALSDGRIDASIVSRTGLIMGNIVLPTDRSTALSRSIVGRTFRERLLGTGLDRPETWSVFDRYPSGSTVGLVARGLGLGGRRYAIDAACASSLFAVKYAVDELRAGRADCMVTGGLSRPDCLYTQMGFSQLGALSPDGRSAPFDARANGLVVGEGAGMVVLKRLRDALDQGDHIYAVIGGVGLSNDTDGSLLAPSSEGQLRAMGAAYRAAGWQPETVSYLECHATGTQLGDAVEFQSNLSLWQDRQWQAGQCVISSAKANIGHLLTASGGRVFD